MDDLIAGYRRFRASTWQTERSRFEALSRLGQRPRALIIACSDSRTDPQMVFNARPGELFVVRNVANIVPPYGPDDHPHGVSSAIEFAVRSLKVREIVVLGHAMCGGIQALLNGAPREVSDFVGQWVSIAEPARAARDQGAARAAAACLRARSGAPVARQSPDLPLDQGRGRGRPYYASRLLFRHPFRRARTARRGWRFSADSGLRTLL